LLSAISYCHSKNVVHRDLKPENLLIEGDAEELIIKVGDFGNSIIFDLKNKISGIFGSLYYMAPEVLDNNYNEKCDEWSCGIILFLLLTGKPPFRGKKTSELVNNIKYAKVITESQDFSAISQEAKDLIHRLMDRNLSKRISASEALSHAWLNKFLNPENPPTALLESVLSNLSLFTNTIKLKNAIFTYVATQCMSQAELKELNSAFKQLDKNSDGKLSKEELFAVYKQKFEGKTSEKEVENIMKNVDTDKSGFIDYTEFIQASLNQKIMFSKSNLEQAFRTFDIDGNGIITASEIAEIFSHDFIGEDAVWQGVLNQVDKNGDGNIDLKEFESILFDRYNSIQE
jgi:calcium-dependent protein kinase